MKDFIGKVIRPGDFVALARSGQGTALNLNLCLVVKVNKKVSAVPIAKLENFKAADFRGVFGWEYGCKYRHGEQCVRVDYCPDNNGVRAARRWVAK